MTVPFPPLSEQTRTAYLADPSGSPCVGAGDWRMGMEVVVPWRYSESVFDVELASSLYQDNAAGLVNSVCDAFHNVFATTVGRGE